MLILLSSTPLITLLIMNFTQDPSGFHARPVEFSEHILVLCSLFALYAGLYQLSVNIMGASLMAGILLRNLIEQIVNLVKSCYIKTFIFGAVKRI